MNAPHTEMYDVLGVAVTATLVQIRAAYRKLAKIHHPDSGGDPETFRVIKQAHDVLTDPERRKAYDETGEVGSDTNEREGDALHLVFAVLNAILGNVHTTENLDLIKVMLARLNEASSKCDAAVLQANQQSEKLKSTAARLKRKSAGKSPMVTMLETHIAKLQKDIASHSDAGKTVARAIEIVSDHEFDFNQAPPQRVRIGTHGDSVFFPWRDLPGT